MAFVYVCNGAGSGTRTRTIYRSRDFKSRVSTDSTIPAMKTSAQTLQIGRKLTSLQLIIR